MVDKVVGEELSEPMLEAKLDVMLEVKLDASGFTTEKTLFCVWKLERTKKERDVTCHFLVLPAEVTAKEQEHKPACLGPHISAPLNTCF